jgi:ferrous iron transport protein B
MRGKTPPFIMELPQYHMPEPKSLMIHLWDKLKGYVKKAFTIILASTIIIWFLQSFTFDWKFIEQQNPNDIATAIYEGDEEFVGYVSEDYIGYKNIEENIEKIKNLDETYVEDGEVVVSLDDLVNEYTENESEEYKAVLDEIFVDSMKAYKTIVEDPEYKDSSNSILAGFGKLIKPLFTPIGFGNQLNKNGWVYGVSAVTGLIAKENVIATFSVLAQSVSRDVSNPDEYLELYAMGLDEEGVSVAVITANATGVSGNGVKGWPVLIAFIVFNMTTIPCFAAVATAKGELGKKKFWTTILFWICTSYIASAVVYLVLSKWWISFIIAALIALLITGLCLFSKHMDKKKMMV